MVPKEQKKKLVVEQLRRFESPTFGYEWQYFPLWWSVV